MNTVVPYTDPAYQRLRPTIAVPPDSLLKIDGQIALHPSLPTLHGWVKNGRATIVQGVGYPNASREHARAAATWHTGRLVSGDFTSGWLNHPLDLGITFYDSWDARLAAIARNSAGKGGVQYAALAGFDTHAGQLGRQGFLLKKLDDALATLQKNLATTGADQRTLILIFSEFGRAAAENGNGGTEHGAAGPVFVIAPGVAGPVIGKHPSLDQLDDGGLAYGIDYRSVYASILRDWLHADHPLTKQSDLEVLSLVRV